MTKSPNKPTSKQALSPRSAKSAAPQPGQKPHKPRPKAGTAAKPAKAAAVPPKRRGPNTGVSQADKLVALLRREGGVTLDAMAAELAVQPHTARAMVTVVARQKLGLAVECKGGVYRVVE